MKTTAAIAALLIILIPLSGYGGATPCDGVDENTITRHIPLPKVSIVTKRVISDTCEVIARVMNEHVPLYVFSDYVIAGDLFKDKKHITQQSIGETQAKSFSDIKQEVDQVVAFSYKPASGAERYVYMFTDPECQFCELAKYQIRDFAEKRKVEIKVVFFPLAMHDGAREKAIKAICSKMDYARYIDGDYSGTFCREGEDKVGKSLSLGESLEINGTPTFIGPDGRRTVGFDTKLIEGIL
ncbi:MAG: thioredoxin fold domain-containing protein [Nitrospirae bacterium]|nr:thioredoxin fold domain-containing protein [Nitrospirota bacterium]MCL5021910.1 thioredoxin fold domain-containing protein [Nitrospirota bacterium]